MGLSTITGDDKPGKEQAPPIEYTAHATSPLVNGEVKLTINEAALTVAALYDVTEIPFAEMNMLTFVNYVVAICADSGEYAFTRMGEWGEWFYAALLDAYSKAVLRSLFVSGRPIATASGGYRYVEDGAAGSGSAPVHVYENCVVALPPDLSARRVALCFVTGLDKGEYALTLKLDTGESYTFSKLGHDTAPVEAAIEKQIRALREKTLATIKEIDPSLTAAQASQLVKLLPEGAAASFEQIAEVAPSFVTTVEGKLANTRAAESYQVFKELCNTTQIHVGFRKSEVADGAIGGLGGTLGGLSDATADGEGETEAPAPDPYLFWLIAPSPDGRFAVVEFAEADSATFVYRTGGDFTVFARQLNRALEAIAFKREAIRLSGEELHKSENADCYMAVKRTTALQFVRANFVGRVIHSGVDSWKRKLTEMWGDTHIQSEPVEQKQYCAQCGTELMIGMKFCGKCGAATRNYKN
jgi:hypothetical protein